jgi:hypothetical protein
MVKIFDATLDIILPIAQISRGTVFTRLFLQHPRSVGESYLEHQRHALGFGFSLLLAALACLIHAVVPGLFVHTGGDAITRLHDRMAARRTAGDARQALRVQT